MSFAGASSPRNGSKATVTGADLSFRLRGQFALRQVGVEQTAHGHTFGHYLLTRGSLHAHLKRPDVRLEERQGKLPATLRRDVKPLLLENLIQQGADLGGVLKPQRFPVILDSASECVELGLKFLVQLPCRLEGAIIRPRIGASLLGILSEC